MMKTSLKRLIFRGMLASSMIFGLISATVEAKAEPSASMEPGIATWEVQKSKTATELDSDNNTTVTLSLPAAEMKSKADIVFVMDHSGYADTADIDNATDKMLTTLKAQSANIDISIGVIKFDGWGIDAIKQVSEGKQSDMISLNETNYEVINSAIQSSLSSGIGGSNTEQPIRMANEMLASDTNADAVKYLLVLSDFQTYVYEGSATIGGTTYDNIPVGSTRTYSPDQTNLEDYTQFAEYNTWASLKSIYYSNNKTIPSSDWSQDSQFFRWGYSQINFPYSQFNWINYDYSGKYDTQPSNKWISQNLATYEANKTAIAAACDTQEKVGTMHHVTGNQRSMLLTYDAMEQSLASGTHVIAYRNNGSTSIPWDSILKNFPHDMLTDLSAKGATVFQDDASAVDVFDNLTNSIIYLMGSGTVADKIGDKFDLIKDSECPISMSLSGTTLKCTTTAENEWSFGDANENGIYPYVATYTPGSDEEITWKINVPVEKAKQVKLSYELHLTTDVPGTYDTNKSAVLTYKDSTGKEYSPEMFEVPHVTLNEITKKQSMKIPFDILESNGDDATFINGPINVQSGTKVSYKATINMDQIMDIVDTSADSVGYITGNFTMTLRGTNGLQFKEDSFTSTDIKNYFAGDAVDLFELVSAPAYDTSTNTITFNVKTIDCLENDGILGTSLYEKLKTGIYGYTNANTEPTVTDAINTTGYARIVGTFGGSLNYRNKSGSANYLVTMTGTQDEPAVKADTTLGTFGTEAMDAVSATLLYQQVAITPTTAPAAPAASANETRKIEGSVNTGEQTNVMAWTGFMVISILTCIGVAVMKKKKSN